KLNFYRPVGRFWGKGPLTPIHPGRSTWGEVATFHNGYHKGAKWCFRSHANEAGHANQCCYDECGKLILEGSGRGSADWVVGSAKTFLQHKQEDMNPADWAHDLDGGDWGCWSE